MYVDTPRWTKMIFWYRANRSKEVQAMIEAVRRIRIFDKKVLLPLSGISFDGCELPAFGVSEAIIHGSTFRGCICVNSDFSDGKLVFSSFEGAMLNNVNFRNCAITQCNFNNANLEGTDFTDAEVDNCTFMDTVNLTKSIGLDPEIIKTFENVAAES